MTYFFGLSLTILGYGYSLRVGKDLTYEARPGAVRGGEGVAALGEAPMLTAA